MTAYAWRRKVTKTLPSISRRAALLVATAVATIAFAAGTSRGQELLTDLAKEVQTKGEPAADFDVFAEPLGVAEDDGTLRVIRTKHRGRLRMVWARRLPDSARFDVVFADFQPEYGMLYLTDDSGGLRRAVRLTRDIPTLQIGAEAALPGFEKERDFWLRWAR